MKRSLPYAMTVVAAVTVMACVFFGIGSRVQQEIDQWYTVSSAMVCAFGLVNLTAVHLKRIQRKAQEWDLSVLLLVLTYGYLILGLVKGPTDELYTWIFNATAVPLGATFYALLAFYITSAAYRAFRAKTRDAAILLAAAIIVLIGKAPLGEYLFPAMGKWTQWIIDIPAVAAMRSVVFGATLGGLISAIRILLGFDRPYAAGGE